MYNPIKNHFHLVSKIIYVDKHRTEFINASLLGIEVVNKLPSNHFPATTTLATPKDKAAAIPTAIAPNIIYIALARSNLSSEFLIQHPRPAPGLFSKTDASLFTLNPP